MVVTLVADFYLRASIRAFWSLLWDIFVKKGLLALLLVVVLVIIVSPGIIGKLAERSIGENLNWAVRESGELVVSSQSFERSWFSSEGQHRIELGDGALRAAVTGFGATGAELPALIITTHIDHGLIALSSLRREGGSLAPGLGSAVSTMTIELGNDEVFALPGTVYSEIGLGGDLTSSYALDAGTMDFDDGTITWEPGNIDFSTDPSSGRVVFDGSFGAISISNKLQSASIESLAFSGEQAQTQYGFAVGDVNFSMGEMSVHVADTKVSGMRRLSVVGSSSLNEGNVDARSVLKIEAQTIPGFGDISITADVSIVGADAAAVGKASKRLQEVAANQGPSQILTGVADDLKDLFAAGFDMNINQLDIKFPQGTVETRVTVAIPESDRANFQWTSLLLNTVASVDIRIPAALMDMAIQTNPQASIVVAMGYLKKNGDAYEMEARYKKGVMMINGAPIPIPFGAFQ